MRTEAGSFVCVLSLALAACSVPPVPHAPLIDAAGGPDAWREDSGSILVHDTGPRDTGAQDSSFDSSVDAPIPDTGSGDAGPPLQITVDGLFTDPYWSTVSGTTNGTSVLTPFDQQLTALHYGRDTDWFYMGFESGALHAGDAVVVYVDTASAAGVPLATGLGDSSNAVNQVLSLQITSTAEFQPEFGWGTSMMPHSIGATDGTLGWRQLAMNPGPFTNVHGGNVSACSATGCETAILLSQIGLDGGGQLDLVVRMGRPGVGFSNQTFPVTDSASPETITDWITVP
jgi:hypothetical protein